METRTVWWVRCLACLQAEQRLNSNTPPPRRGLKCNDAPAADLIVIALQIPVIGDKIEAADKEGPWREISAQEIK